MGVHPHLDLLGGLSTWSLAAALATVVAVIVGLRAAREVLPLRLLIELAIVVVAGGWLSAKIGHVLFEARGHALAGGQVAHGVVDLLRADPWHWARLFEPGFVQLAGIAGAVVIGVVFLVRQGEARHVGAIADAAAVAVAVGVGLGRVGCFFAGCCHGRGTDVAWAVRFPVDHVTGGVPVHPTQLYDLVVATVAGLGWLLVRRRQPGSGAMLVAAVLLVGRVVTELFRGDLERGSLGPLSTSQVLALLALLALAVLWWRRRRPGHLDAAAEPAIVGRHSP